MDGNGHWNDDWRRDLRSKLAWIFVAKLAGLAALWFLFFRGHV